eukprot:gene4650-8223_t
MTAEKKRKEEKISITELQKRIPKECFEKSLVWSTFYFLRDLFFLFICYMAYPYCNNIILKFIWWNVTGFFMWCLFVVGHDCGHTNFSNYEFINDLVGHISHTLILVPYHAWRLDHYVHHTKHNNFQEDPTWMPAKKEDYDQMYALERYLRFGYGLLISAPLYMLFYVPSHTNPWNKSVYKNDKEFYQGFQTMIWMCTWLGFLFYKFPLLTVIDAYIIPVVFFGYWLFLVTMLHHTAPSGKYYDKSEWTFLKGAETTYDRNYGWLIEHLHHDIGTHVIHHIFFSKVPHYHLVKATEATKEYLKDFRQDLSHVGIKDAFEQAVYQCRWAEKANNAEDHEYIYMS